MKRILSLAIVLAFTASASAQSTPAFQASSSTAKPATQTQMNANAELLFMLEQLQQEVQSLRGVVEKQSHEIKQLKQKGRDRYRDLDQRLLKLQSSAVSSSLAEAPLTVASSSATRPAAIPVSTGVATVAQVSSKPSAEQQRAYQHAYGLIKQKKYDQAVDELHKFIKSYPSSDLTGNAYYWLGEVYLVMPKFEQARQAFKVVVGSFSAHRKAPDAMYKLGVTYHRLDNLKEAKFYLSEVSKRYPDSSAAKLAKEYREKL